MQLNAKRHEQRFAFWTEEASCLLKGNLEPLFRMRTPALLKPDEQAVADCSAEYSTEEPRIMRDLYTALCWIRKNYKLFQSNLTEPAVLHMKAEEQQEELREVMQGQSIDGKDPFMFSFQYREDLETFLCNCVDRMGLKVNAIFM